MFNSSGIDVRFHKANINYIGWLATSGKLCLLLGLLAKAAPQAVFLMFVLFLLLPPLLGDRAAKAQSQQTCTSSRCTQLLVAEAATDTKAQRMDLLAKMCMSSWECSLVINKCRVCVTNVTICM